MIPKNGKVYSHKKLETLNPVDLQLFRKVGKVLPTLGLDILVNLLWN